MNTPQFMTSFFFVSDKGKVREKNEDAFACFKAEFFVLADGLGGLPAGEIASQLAVKVAADVYQQKKEIKLAFKAANSEVYRQARENPLYFGMSTTLVGVTIKGKRAVFANVGDSRAYLLSADKMVQISKNHGLGMGVVTRALGIQPEVKIDLFKKELKKGDFLLLCSDGLTNMLSDEEILAMLKNTGRTKKELEKKAKELVEAANRAGGFDNITVGLVKLD